MGSEMSFSWRLSVWVCLLMFKGAELCSVCKDKTYEYLSRAICHMTPDISLCSSFCGLPCSLNMSASRFVYFPSCFTVFYLSLLSTGRWRTHCRCSVSSSVRPLASLMSAWLLWSCLLMFWGVLPFQSLLSSLSLSFVSSSSLSPSCHRWFLHLDSAGLSWQD